jgi:hypothetical protein
MGSLSKILVLHAQSLPWEGDGKNNGEERRRNKDADFPFHIGRRNALLL